MNRDEPPFNSKGPSGGSFSSGGASGGGETGLSRLRRERERVDAQRAASKETQSDSFGGQNSHGNTDAGGYSRSFERTGRFARADGAGSTDTGGSAARSPLPTRDRYSQTDNQPSGFQPSLTGGEPGRPSIRERRVPIVDAPDVPGEPVRMRGTQGTRQDTQAPRQRIDFSAANARPSSPDSRDGALAARGERTPSSSRIERVRPGERDPSWRMERDGSDAGAEYRSAEFERQAPQDAGETAEDARTPAVDSSRLGQNFRSRFAKPPKAYDLDEIGDKGLPLDLLEEGENANFEPANEVQETPDPGYSPPREATKPAQAIRRRSRVDFSSRAARSRDDTVPHDQNEQVRQVAESPDDNEQPRQGSRRISPGAYPPPPSPEPQGDYFFEDEAVAQAPVRPAPVDPVEEVQSFNAEMQEPFQDYATPAVTADRQEEFPEYGYRRSPVAENAYAQETQEEFYPDPYSDPSDEQFATPQAQGAEVSFDDLDDFEPLPNYDDTIDPQDVERAQEALDSFQPETHGPYIDEEFGEPEQATATFSDLRADVDATDRGAKPDYSGTFNDFESKGSRKKPLLLVASLAGVAVIAGGLIFTYQKFSGGGDREIPIVKLDEAATRVAPDEPGGEEIPHQNKLIYDRIVGEKSTVDEQIVSREEDVINLNAGTNDGQQPQAGTETANGLEIPPAPISPDDTDVNTSIDNGRDDAIALLQPSSDSSASSVGTPIVPTPTVPEETETANEPAPEPSSTVPDLRVETVSPPEPEPVPDTSRPAPPVPRNKPPAPKSVTRVASNNNSSSNTGPIKLTPAPRTGDTPSAAPSTAVQSVDVSEATQTAPAPAPSIPATAVGTGNYMIQIAAFRSEAEAIAEYQRLRGRHSGLLAGYEPVIQKADLQARGIYYRLRLGPIDGKGRARGLCDSLLAAGETDCLVRTR